MSTGEPALVANRFRSLFVLGRGGMGSVDAALELGEEGARRIVALKRMLPESSVDRSHIDMFMREAHVAEMLSHPNVVHAFASGEDERELFLAMEYVEGEPLSRVLTAVHSKEGRVAPPLVAHILAEICEGLHAAHELVDTAGKPLNLVHRDVSPHNVMVAYSGPVKLLDFGVVKIDQLDAKGRTKTGEIKGKTAYMSPEQAMGEPLDRRSDLYSLGAVLFESLAGQRMWGTGTDFDVLRRLALEEPPRLSDAAPKTPKALCELHARLVARNRDARPATARAVGIELRAFIESTGTRPDEQVVRAVMHRLFPAEIQRRRETLSRALESAVPGNGSEDLRKSLVTGLSETKLEAVAPADAQPVVVRARGMISLPPPADAPAYPDEADTEIDAGVSHGDLEPASVPMQKARAVPWAIAAAALLVLGSVAFLRFASPSGAATHEAAAEASASPSAAPPRSRPDASRAAATALVEPKPPHVGLSLAPEPEPHPPSSPPAATRPPKPPRQTVPPAGATGATPASSAPPNTPPPLDEHPI